MSARRTDPRLAASNGHAIPHPSRWRRPCGGLFVTAPRPQAQTFTAPAGGVDAPDPNVPLFFEAASVKPSDPKAGPGAGIRRQPGGRFNTFNTPVRLLITFAYQIQGYQLVGGPDWIGNTRYDIVAKMEGDRRRCARHRRGSHDAGHAHAARRALQAEGPSRDARARYLRVDDGQAGWQAGAGAQDGLRRLLPGGVRRAARCTAASAGDRSRSAAYRGCPAASGSAATR